MKRIYKVYKKTVSIVNETPTAMYENLVGSRKGFLLESYDKNAAVVLQGKFNRPLVAIGDVVYELAGGEVHQIRRAVTQCVVNLRPLPPVSGKRRTADAQAPRAFGRDAH